MVCIAYVTGTKKGQNIFKHILKIFTSKTYKKKKKCHEFFEKIVRILNWMVHGLLYLQTELEEEQGTHQMLLDAIDKAWTRKLVK